MLLDYPTYDVQLRGCVLRVLGMLCGGILVLISGLRSFAKMTNFDFVMAVVLGSLLASTSLATSWDSFYQAVIELASLFCRAFRFCKASQNL